MKFIKVFSLFVILHVFAWIGAHLYLRDHPSQVLLVVDTSYAMKPKFPAVDQWIENFERSSRYQNIQVGTDKAMLGSLEALPSRSVIFRTAFGKMSEENLSRYQGIESRRKILLSDGSFQLEGWELVSF